MNDSITTDDVPASVETPDLVVEEKKITRDELLALPTNFGRNDLCPCGSGKKMKRCHREFIAQVRAFQVHDANQKRLNK